MANYYCTMRSNYFRVKDLDKFQKFLALFSGMILFTEGNKVGFYDETGEASIPSFYWDEGGNEVEVDFIAELSTHLADDEVGIIMEAGAEKVRYVSGFAIAFNNKGEVEQISLSDIYEKAKTLGKNITEASY